MCRSTTQCSITIPPKYPPSHWHNCSRKPRGTSGFDNSGRGYFFANRRGEGPDNQRHHPNRDPYDQAQKPFANHYNPQSHQNPPKTQITPEFYNGKPSQTTQTISSGTIGTIDSNPMKNNSDSNKEIENKDQNR